MNRTLVIGALILLSACPNPPDTWTRDFSVRKETLKSLGANQFVPLRPGTRQILVNGPDTLVVTVLAETRVVDGVETRIVEERESRGGRLVEVSRTFLASDPATQDVYSFGEDVDLYTDGRVTGHEGSWVSGVNGARFGLLMPAKPSLYQRFYREQAPGVAMDRAEIVALEEVFSAEVGRYLGCVRVEETTPLESGPPDVKVYCPGIGLVRDGEFKLVEVTIP
jgi:hypothetical protein